MVRLYVVSIISLIYLGPFFSSYITSLSIHPSIHPFIYLLIYCLYFYFIVFFPKCMSVNHVYAVPHKPEEGIGFPGLSSGCRESKMGPQGEQPMLLIPEPSLQHHELT